MVHKSLSVSNKSDQSKRIICMNRSTLYNINNVISVRKNEIKNVKKNLKWLKATRQQEKQRKSVLGGREGLL